MLKYDKFLALSEQIMKGATVDTTANTVSFTPEARRAIDDLVELIIEKDTFTNANFLDYCEDLINYAEEHKVSPSYLAFIDYLTDKVRCAKADDDIGYYKSSQVFLPVLQYVLQKEEEYNGK